MDKNIIKSNVNHTPIIISAKKQQNDNLNRINSIKNNSEITRSFERNNDDIILSNTNSDNNNLRKKEMNDDYGKEIILIEKGTMATPTKTTTGYNQTGPHVVKIRVNPSKIDPAASLLSIPSAVEESTTTTISKQPVLPNSFYTFPIQERSPATLDASRPTFESSTNLENNQSSTNTVRINIGKNSMNSTTTTTKLLNKTTTSNQEHINMAPSPLPPNSTYFFTSPTYDDNGQISPASDSGTCSDLDSSNTSSPLPKNKKEKPTNSLNNNEITLPITQTSKVTITSAVTKNLHENNMLLINHQRGSSLTSSGADVEESDDNISCDSLNSGELDLLNNNNINNNKNTKIIEFTKKILQNNNNDDEDVRGNNEKRNQITPVIEERTYEERLRGNQQKVISNGSKISKENNRFNSMKITSEKDTNDKHNSKESENFDCFYKFHLNENNFDNNNSNNSFSIGGDNSKVILKNGACVNEDNYMVDYFAGCKNYNEVSDPETSTIRSSKGTIRGVKNRVRAGIATFLQMHSTKSWQEKEVGKVVVYTTTMGIVRETYQRCLKVRQILRTHLVKFDEKDVFMSREIQTEIRERMGTDNVSLPQVFVEGHHIGDAETVERLNENGELRRILKPYKSPDACTTCKVCGGYRLLPCPVCNGSKKSVHRNHFTTELVALKCMNCDEVGLIRCYEC